MVRIRVWGSRFLILKTIGCEKILSFGNQINERKANKEKQVIEFDSLEMALTYAEQDFKDRWEFYKNRYLKKLKK